MKNTTQLTLLVVGLFCTIFPLIWCGVILIISHVSGWQTLAKTYSTDSFPTNATSCSGIFNVASNYSATLEYAETKDGLYLKTIALFKMGHKPLFIPWTAMQGFEQSGSLFAKHATTFNVNGVRIKLFTKAIIRQQR